MRLLPKLSITTTEVAAAVDSADPSASSKVKRKVSIKVSLPDYLSPRQRSSGAEENGADADDELATAPARPSRSSPPAAATSSIKTIAPNWMVKREDRVDQSSVTVATKPVSSASPRGKWVPPKRPPGVVVAATAAQPGRKENVSTPYSVASHLSFTPLPTAKESCSHGKGDPRIAEPPAEGNGGGV